MDREEATRIRDRVLEVTGDLNCALAALEGVVTDRAFQQIRCRIGALMGELYLEVLREVFERHPDLEPDAMKRETMGGDVETMDPDIHGAGLDRCLELLDGASRRMERLAIASGSEESGRDGKRIDFVVGSLGPAIHELSIQLRSEIADGESR